MKTHLSILFFVLLLASGPCFGQWSTSTRTDSSLYVCPGFYPGILTFEDGSSIIIGILDSYIFAQKLDPFGYKMWPQPVPLMHWEGALVAQTDNFSRPDWGRITSDGDGGAIIIWYDHRDAVADSQSGRWLNNSLYAQRVDKYGRVRWDENGLLISDAQEGLKSAELVTDGIGGCFLGWGQHGFGYPGAPDSESINLARLSPEGNTVWKKTVQSSKTTGTLGLKSLTHIDSFIIEETNVARFILDTTGHPITFNSFTPGSYFINDPQDGFFELIIQGLYPDVAGGQNFFHYKFKRWTSKLDTIWSCLTEIPDEAGRLGYARVKRPLVPDGTGGLFDIWGFSDANDRYESRAQRINASGAVWDSGKVHVYDDLPIAAFVHNGFYGIFFDFGYAQLYDSLGNPLWGSNRIRVISDPANAEFGEFADDHNGGGIYCFWQYHGVGIYAIHTGRNGKVGVITGVSNDQPLLPTAVHLEQNYPNPFNPQTTIQYSIPEAGHVRLVVFNTLGQVVKVLVDETQNVAGAHSVQFDGSAMASGLYFYRLEAGKFSQVKKLLLVK